MQLENLPPELLREIISHIDDATGREYADHGSPSLCALALSGARRLAAVATALLYDVITIERNGDGARDGQRMVLLNRSCRANPQLVHRIRSAGIRWSHSVDTTPHYDEFLAHLARSSSLVSLDAQLGRPPPLVPTLTGSAAISSPLPALFEWQAGGFAALRELHVHLNDVDHDARIPVHLLVRLCEMPSLQDITLCVTPAVDDDGDASGNSGKQDSSSDAEGDRLPMLRFTDMCFGGGQPVSIALLRQVLPRATALKTLIMNLPGAAVVVNRKMADDVSSGGYDLKGPELSPRSIGKLLAPIAASLEVLDLLADNVSLPAQHDGSQMDLSAFMRLRTLEITACLLFGAGRGRLVGGTDMWRQLPPALEKLTIAFDGDMGLFWSLAEMREHERAGTFASELWGRRLHDGGGDGLRWLVELLRRLADGKLGNQLRSIAVEEREVVDRDRNWALAAWREPGESGRLRELAQAAAVKLEIQLRVPRAFRSEDIEVTYEAEYHGHRGTVSYEEPEGPFNEGSSPASEGSD
ncbi:hypothetical protein PG984_001315 [Apiospora sp. TS-2023a]